MPRFSGNFHFRLKACIHISGTKRRACAENRSDRPVTAVGPGFGNGTHDGWFRSCAAGPGPSARNKPPGPRQQSLGMLSVANCAASS